MMNILSINLKYSPFCLLVSLLAEVSWIASIVYGYFNADRMTEVWDWWMRWFILSFVLGVAAMVIGYIAGNVIKFWKEAK